MDMTIAQRLETIRENIEKAAAGRAITLVGAAKTKPAELIRAAVAAGLEAVGENYVQEFREKSAQGAYEGAGPYGVGIVLRHAHGQKIHEYIIVFFLSIVNIKVYH